jgi:hypothetical protein
MMTSIAAYEYEPLPGPRWIRVLKLYSGHYEDDIICSLEEVPIDDHPIYEALSYCWATEDEHDTRSQLITCDGRSIAITKNCELAIRRLRYKPPGSSATETNEEHHERTLWIDAICIVQSDTNERSQ